MLTDFLSTGHGLVVALRPGQCGFVCLRASGKEGGGGGTAGRRYQILLSLTKYWTKVSTSRFPRLIIGLLL